MLLPLILGSLLAIAYFGEWKDLVWTWANSPEMNHGFLAIPIASFMIYQMRPELKKLPESSSNWGIVLLGLAAALAVVGSISRWVFASQFAILLSLLGALLYSVGPAIVRSIAFPLGVLSLMIPPPSMVYTWVTFRLQLLASWAAERVLDVLGYTVLREGNVLEIVGERLLVAEACSGIRSLLTLVFFFAVYCFFFVPSTRLRFILLLATVPITIAGNILRVVATAIVAHHDRALAHGVLHESAGFAILAIGALAGILLHRLLARQSWSAA